VLAVPARRPAHLDDTPRTHHRLRIDQHGETGMMQADKWKLTHKLGVQGRDLRIMDPSLATSYPSAILCRDKALVVSLEHIKVIITTSAVLVMNPEDENVLPFITGAALWV
jgi:magnesium transporter